MPQATVYYTCSYVPPEIIWAAGATPVRLLPERRAPGVVDGYLPRDYCPYVRAALHTLLGAAATAVVATTCCDPMRRLADVLRYERPDLPLFMLDLPRGNSPRARQYFQAELEYLHRALLGLTGGGREPQEAVHLFGELRRRWRRWSEQPARLNPLLRQALIGEEGVAEPEAGAEAPPTASGEDQRPRLLVVTSHPVEPALLAEMERAGARVVAEDSCLGRRWLDMPEITCSPEGGWAELAAGYLGRPPCPRMERPRERLNYLKGLAREEGAQGAVFLALKYCDNLSYDFPRMKAELGLPLLFVETDYGCVLSGQVRTRIQAFIEALGMQG